MCHPPQRAYYAARAKLPKEEREHAPRADCPPDGRGSPRAPGKGRARAKQLLSTGGTRSCKPYQRRTTAWWLEGWSSCPGEGTRLARGSPVGAGLRTVGGMVRLDAVSHIGAFSSEGHYYWWLEGYMERLEGKEARAEYYMLLEAAGLASLRG